MTFEYTPTEDGFRIRDTVENAWIDVDVDDGRSLHPEPANTDVFRVPLDEAVTVEATALEFSADFGIVARTGDGTHLEYASFDDTLSLDPGTYEIETTLQSIKLYLYVEASRVRTHDRPTTSAFSFHTPTRVVIGVRSNHARPAGVVTASQDPRDLMRAISTFGTALKTHSPERSFPTLRGHPPELAIRGQTDIPDDLAPPDTGITLEIPPTYEAIFAATPAAYYFGATLEPGLNPCLRAAGSRHELDEASFGSDIHELLGHCILLDCVVRSVGIYPTPLQEADVLADHATIDAETLYHLPLDERTARYLDVPLDATRDLLPWTHVADVDPVPLNAEALPYLAYRMAVIRSPAQGTRVQTHTTPGAGDEDGAQNETSATPAETAGDVRSFFPDTTDIPTRVRPAPFDAQQHLWVADGIPVGGVKPTLGSYLRSVDADRTDETIEMHVVHVDDGAAPVSEHDVDCGRVSPRNQTEIECVFHENPTTSELKDVLQSDVDFLHYRGPVTADGLTCLDGPLDLRTLPRTGVSSFFFDGAQSHRQGLALVRVGSVGGIVTLGDSSPLYFGRAIAELLDDGFSLSAATSVLIELDGASQYAVVGDGDHQVCKSPDTPMLTRPAGDGIGDTRVVDTTCFATLGYRLGTQMEFAGDQADRPSLLGDHCVHVTRDSLDAFKDRMEHPLLVDGDLYWLDDLSADDLWELLR